MSHLVLEETNMCYFIATSSDFRDFLGERFQWGKIWLMLDLLCYLFLYTYIYSDKAWLPLEIMNCLSGFCNQILVQERLLKNISSGNSHLFLSYSISRNCILLWHNIIPTELIWRFKNRENWGLQTRYCFMPSKEMRKWSLGNISKVIQEF